MPITDQCFMQAAMIVLSCLCRYHNGKSQSKGSMHDFDISSLANVQETYVISNRKRLAFSDVAERKTLTLQTDVRSNGEPRYLSIMVYVCCFVVSVV